MPHTARSLAAAGGPGTPGPLVATFTVTRDSQNHSLNNELGKAAGRWEVSEAAKDAGFEARGGTTRLIAPAARPYGWVGLEVVGGDGYSSVVMPYFGEIHNPAGIGGTIVALSGTERLSLRTHVNQNPREIRLFGADTPAVVGQTFHIRAVIG